MPEVDVRCEGPVIEQQDCHPVVLLGRSVASGDE
jgi:hypothetical protein